MGLLARLFFAFISNLVAIFLTDYFIAGFEVKPDLESFLLVALLFTLLNVFLKPVLKFILAPVIILTLGLFSLVLNAALLYALDLISESLTINGLVPLFYATLVMSFVNVTLHFLDRSRRRTG